MQGFFYGRVELVKYCGRIESLQLLKDILLIKHILPVIFYQTNFRYIQTCYSTDPIRLKVSITPSCS